MRKIKQGRIPNHAIAEYKPFRLPEHINKESVRNAFKTESYTDEQLQEMREAINFLHELCYQAWVHQKQNTPILKVTKNEESHSIYPSEYRRAS